MDNSLLLGQEFEVDLFLHKLATSASLTDIRDDVNEYHSKLKQELVKLINDDYHDFISITTSIDPKLIIALTHPLPILKQQVEQVRSDLALVQSNFLSKLTQRANLRDQKLILLLLLRLSDSLSRLESLITVDSPNVTHIARVASEYTQLTYHATKARQERCLFLQTLQPRIDNVHASLTTTLSTLFINSLSAQTYPDIALSLRTYDLLGLYSDAEHVLRTHLVRPFIKKTIFPGALAAPLSPLVPHTPFSTRSFTTALTHTLIDESHDNNLARVYNQILRFVERDLVRIMVLAEGVSATHSDADPDHIDTDKDTDTNRFHILSNVIWQEIAHAITTDLGTVVFASGHPNEFHKNYTTTYAFQRALEALAPSARSASALRAHPTFLAFHRRWQLNVYFQMRWRDIITRLEAVLSSTDGNGALPDRDGDGFMMVQTRQVYTAMCSCWNADIFIPELAHRFWRLTLQLLSRYNTWLDVHLAPFVDVGPAGASTNTLNPDPLSAEHTAADDLLLRSYAAAIVDLTLLATRTRTLWEREIRSAVRGVDLDQTLTASLAHLTTRTPHLSTRITTVLARRACDALPVRSVPYQFRAMAHKHAPSAPSDFVSGVLKPVRVFFGLGLGAVTSTKASDGTDTSPGARLPLHFQREYAETVFERAAQRYAQNLTAMRKTEESLRRLKKGPSQAGLAHTHGRDEERTRAQMVLDVESFAREARALGVDVDSSPAFASLSNVVRAAPPV